MRKTSLLQSFNYAIQGVLHAAEENRNLKIHFVTGVLVLVLSVFLKVSRFETLILIVMIISVISAEMINTSIEDMTDLITSEHKQEAKTAKDVAAGMVLVASIGAAVVGVYILLPYLLKII